MTKLRGTGLVTATAAQLASILVMAAAMTSISVPASADDQDSQTQVAQPKGQKHKKEETSKSVPTMQESQVAPGDKNIDDMITNNNLRALSGSKSRWSLSSTFTYNGGTLESPFAEFRPDISGGSATSTDTDINALLNLKYNLTKQQALLLGFGIRKMAPFVASGPSSDFYSKGGKDFDAYDPSITYQYIYKLGGIQSVLQAGYLRYTREDIRSSKKGGGNLSNGFSLDQENIYEIGKTHISVGASVGVSMNTPTDWAGDYSQFQLWLDPYLEYQINDWLNFRTVANVWTYEYYNKTPGIARDTYTESVGFGFAVSRDTFLYPNVQFLPENTSMKLTNVGLTATVNWF